jgi:hypothetical protein
MMPEEVRRALARRPLTALAVTAIGLKLVQVALDPAPLLFWGDSWAHLATALTGHVPEERSWSYGLLIRPATVWTGSLACVVPVQALAGAATCCLLARWLSRDFRVRFTVAFAVVVAFAFEPMQILLERFVLTESFAGLVFAAYLTCAFAYLERPRPIALVWVAGVGIVLVSLRTVYVPLTLVGALLLPLLARPGGWRSRSFASHAAVAILATAVCHLGYMHLTGRMLGRPSAYQHGDGHFLAAAWWQILTPEDGADPAAAAVLGRLKEHPPDPQGMTEREFHRWIPGGFSLVLLEACGGDVVRANAAAKATALRALVRDPTGVLAIGWSNYAAYWSADEVGVHARLLADQGAYNPADSPMNDLAREEFGTDFSRQPETPTLSKSWHLAGAPWYFVLTLAPVLCALAALTRGPRSSTKLWFASAVSSVLLASTSLFGIASAYRFLHPFALPTALAIGVLVEAALEQLLPPAADDALALERVD